MCYEFVLVPLPHSEEEEKKSPRQNRRQQDGATRYSGQKQRTTRCSKVHEKVQLLTRSSSDTPLSSAWWEELKKTADEGDFFLCCPDYSGRMIGSSEGRLQGHAMDSFPGISKEETFSTTWTLWWGQGPVLSVLGFQRC